MSLKVIVLYYFEQIPATCFLFQLVTVTVDGKVRLFTTHWRLLWCFDTKICSSLLSLFID